MLLINLLNGDVDANILYLDLCKNTSGFGHYLNPKKSFFKKKKERLALLSEALVIDDKRKIIVNINPNKLMALADLFTKKQKYNKRALCLALICADHLFPHKNEDLYYGALAQLNKLAEEDRLKNKELVKAAVAHKCKTFPNSLSSTQNKKQQKVEEIKIPNSIQNQKPNHLKQTQQKNGETKSSNNTPSQNQQINEEIKSSNNTSNQIQQINGEIKSSNNTPSQIQQINEETKSSNNIPTQIQPRNEETKNLNNTPSQNQQINEETKSSNNTPSQIQQINEEIKSSHNTPSQNQPINEENKSSNNTSNQIQQANEETSSSNNIPSQSQPKSVETKISHNILSPSQKYTIVDKSKIATSQKMASLKPLLQQGILSVNDKKNEAKQKIMPSLSRTEFQKIINSYQSTSTLSCFSFINPIRSVAIKELLNLLDNNKEKTVFFKNEIEDTLRLESNRRQTLFAVGNSKDANKTSTDAVILQLRQKFITRL